MKPNLSDFPKYKLVMNQYNAETELEKYRIYHKRVTSWKRQFEEELQQLKQNPNGKSARRTDLGTWIRIDEILGVAKRMKYYCQTCGEELASDEGSTECDKCLIRELEGLLR